LRVCDDSTAGRNSKHDRGLDRNLWFNNVERVAAERIGRETVTYVSNIYKYYVACLLIQGEYLQRRQMKKVCDQPPMMAESQPQSSAK
jgi:hypothetical protein